MNMNIGDYFSMSPEGDHREHVDGGFDRGIMLRGELLWQPPRSAHQASNETRQTTAPGRMRRADQQDACITRGRP